MELEPRFTEAEIRAAVRDIAARISDDLRGETPLLIGVLKGSFVFLADLVRELTVPCEVDFVRARSYGSGTRSSGTVEITSEPEIELAGRHVIVVEDIMDTGRTLDAVVERMSAGRPASLRRCALLVREGSEAPEYAGLWLPPGFVVGYGLDYAERYRGLRDIRAISDG